MLRHDARGTSRDHQLTFYVSPTGSDGWTGTLPRPNADMSDGPFATLERARDAIRSCRMAGAVNGNKAEVVIRGGTYHLSHTFLLDGRDGAFAEALTFRPYSGEGVEITGDRAIHGRQDTTDASTLSRLPAAARGRVRQTSLRDQGIVEFGRLSNMGFGQPEVPAPAELFAGNTRMTLARWPNGGNWARSQGHSARPGAISYDGSEPARWATATDVWLHGFWSFDWADSYVRVGSIDVAEHQIVTDSPSLTSRVNAGRRYYALNLLEELDSPGEWYLDRKSGILYFWPPSRTSEASASVSLLESPLIALRGSRGVSFRGLVFARTRGAGVEFMGTEDCYVTGSVFRNIGGVAMRILNSTRSGLRSSNVYAIGQGGVYVDGGNRTTLAAGDNVISNNRFTAFNDWVYTYRPAVKLVGVGNRAVHNSIQNAPHAAIIVSGNDHVVEYNDISRVCTETSDSGAIYMGRDFTQRGTVVRFNRLADIGPVDRFATLDNAGVVGVYLDDFTSGVVVERNLFERAGRAVLVGGGRDNLICRNVFIDCNPAIQIDQRGKSWALKHVERGDTWGMIERVNAVPYDRGAYLRYPHLKELLADDPGAAKYNRVSKNVFAGNGRGLLLLDGLIPRDVDASDNTSRDRDSIDGASEMQRGIPLSDIGVHPDADRRLLSTVDPGADAKPTGRRMR